MKIAYVIDRIEPFYRGGYERRAWEIARRLASRHEVTVLTSADSDQTIAGVKFLAVCPRLAYFKSNGFRDLKKNAAFATMLLRYLVASTHFDVIDCNATPFLHIFPSALLARRWNAAFLVTAHEALAGTMNGYFRARSSALPSVSARAARALYYRSQRLADGLIAPSEVTGELLRAEGFSGVEICSGGVSECFPPKTAPSGRLTFVGRLVPNKKVDVLLRAFAAAGPDSTLRALTIVGDGPERDRLERLADSLRILPQVKFVGEVSDARKGEILAAETDVFVSASIREGISFAILEALAAGNPAIISYNKVRSQNGATEYLLDGINGLVTDGEVASLTTAMKRIMADPDYYALLSRNAVKTASRYSWDKVVEDIEGIYERAATAHVKQKRVQRDRPAQLIDASSVPAVSVQESPRD